MTTKAQKREMLDYLVAHLEGSNSNVTPISKCLVGDKDSNYILIGERGSPEFGIVLSVDRTYTKAEFEKVYGLARGSIVNVCPVFFKDGKTFFRSAAQNNYFKQRNDLSLKHYDTAQMQKMMLLRPEEIMMLRGDSVLQYYQPESAQLTQGIASFEFGPVHYDYSHIDSNSRFKPQNRDSERLFIWGNRRETSGPLILNGRHLSERTA